MANFIEEMNVTDQEIRNLKLTHIQDSRVILEDFSMVLNPGDRAVIIGERTFGKGLCGQTCLLLI